MKMDSPVLEVVRFTSEDVVATSGNPSYPTLTLYGLNDTTKSNGRMVLSNGTDTVSFSPGETDVHIRQWYPTRPGSSETYDGVGVATADNQSGFWRLTISDSEGRSVDWANGVFTYNPNYTDNNYMWFVK